MAYFFRFDFADGSSYTQRQDVTYWEAEIPQATGSWTVPTNDEWAAGQIEAFALEEGLRMVQRHGGITGLAAWHLGDQDTEARSPHAPLIYLGETIWKGSRAQVFEDPTMQGYRVTWASTPGGAVSLDHAEIVESCPPLIAPTPPS